MYMRLVGACWHYTYWLLTAQTAMDAKLPEANPPWLVGLGPQSKDVQTVAIKIPRLSLCAFLIKHALAAFKKALAVLCELVIIVL